VTQHPPRPLAMAVRRFLRAHPRLATPDGAYGACGWASDLLAHTGRLRGATMIHLIGSRVPFPRRHADWRHYPALDREFYHMVARVGRWYVDLTRRQLDPASPCPYYRTEAQMRRGWITVSTRDPYL
jgi:hypothetical protein